MITLSKISCKQLLSQCFYLLVISLSYQNVNFLITPELCWVCNKRAIPRGWIYSLLYFLIISRPFRIGKCNHSLLVAFTSVFVIYLLSLPCFILAGAFTTLTFIWFMKVPKNSGVIPPWVWVSHGTIVSIMHARYQLWLQHGFSALIPSARLLSPAPVCRATQRKPWSLPGAASHGVALSIGSASCGGALWNSVCKLREKRRLASTSLP